MSARGGDALGEALLDCFDGAAVDFRAIERAAARRPPRETPKICAAVANGVARRFANKELSFAASLSRFFDGLKLMEKLSKVSLYALGSECCDAERGFEECFRSALRDAVLCDDFLERLFAELREEVIAARRGTPFRGNAAATARFLSDFSLWQRWLEREIPFCCAALWRNGPIAASDLSTALNAFLRGEVESAAVNARLFGEFAGSFSAAERAYFVAVREDELMGAAVEAIALRRLSSATAAVQLLLAGERAAALQLRLAAEQRARLLAATDLCSLCALLEAFGEGAAQLFGDSAFPWELEHQAAALLHSERRVSRSALEHALRAAHSDLPRDGFRRLLALTLDFESRAALCLAQLLCAHIAERPPNALLGALADELSVDATGDAREAIARLRAALAAPQTRHCEGVACSLVTLDRCDWPNVLPLDEAFDSTRLLALPQMRVFARLLANSVAVGERRRLVYGISRVGIALPNGSEVSVSLTQAAVLLHCQSGEPLSVERFLAETAMSAAHFAEQLALLNADGAALIESDGFLRLCTEWNPRKGADFSEPRGEATLLAECAEPLTAEAVQRRVKAALVRQTKQLRKAELTSLLRLINEEFALRLSMISITPLVESLLSEGLLSRYPSDPQILLYN